ncbi:tetratricopeptide repeat protein 27 homolog isoform X2 [Tripterygium wilfordii]|uniref:tetratricopeptide repeat protein 27 homolog isoform X2 n=1 Tax=Tripterygium wilfordii TaxID=458696 RepID=UPI0018F8646B|nr:tetratricopeptide repeat protein 27 homolog isoform X2 [Tripterygium wilfordii]
MSGSLSSTYGIRSISWWLARLLLIQQRILDERSSSLCDLLQVTLGETLHHFGTFKKVYCYWGTELHDGEASAIASVVHLEAGINEYIYGRVDPCRKHFESAEEAAGIQLSVTGVLGFRTVHQVDPKAQRVLITKTVPSNGAGTYPAVTTGIQTHDCTVDKNKNETNEPDETCDIYMTPKLLEKGSDFEINIQSIQNAGHAAAPLTEIQQAVILAHCLLIEKSSRQDELQRWDMAPYIEAIDSQQSSYFTLRSFCDILRIRWELTRSRTKWRALELMEKLVKGIQGPSPGVAERIPFICSVYLPVVPALQKEYGETLVGCGLIGEAITVFEGLELWDNLIYCNCLLGKKAAAVELIKTRLSELPNDPRLWCSLGDVTNNDDCYEKALEVSKNRSARAKRSLARSAYNRGDYEKSKLLWESAMALNSLYPDGWFALGAASLKARDVEKALDAFTRAVQLDPENGEAWNNIACLHMIKKRSKEAFIAFKEALKFKRDSWQLWENYSHVAMDVGNIGQALEGVQRIFNMTGNKRIDTELLERIMLEMEKKSVDKHYVSNASANDLNGSSQTFPVDPHVDSGNESVDVEFAVGSSRETENLLEFLGKVLQQIVKNTSTAEIWGLYARWYKIRGDFTMCSEALLKQVRSYQGSDLWNDGGRFKRYARASLELCKAYMEISSSTGSRRELFTAEMHLKNIIKQADNFSKTQEFRDIQACLEEVKMKLQSG